MQRQHVSSSMIASIGYNPEKRILEIEFIKSGSIYQYPNVPGSIFKGIMSAPSHGKYFHGFINEEFDFIKIR